MALWVCQPIDISSSKGRTGVNGLPALAPALLLCAHLLLLGSVLDCASALQRTRAVRVKELTDANFEHDTQAASGQTTGRWLVIFVGELGPAEFELPEQDVVEGAEADSGAEGDAAGAPKGLRSEELIHSVMRIASEQVPREFVPAIVHLERNRGLKKRFGISSTPQVKLFRDRKMYSFPGVPSSTQELRNFLEIGYSKVPSEEVPLEPDWLQDKLEQLKEHYRAFTAILADNPLYLAAFGGIVAALLCIFTASLLWGGAKKHHFLKKKMAKAGEPPSRAKKVD